MFWFDGRTGRATHYSLRRFRGEDVPDGKMALHSCDNPFCVNPDHLFVGSAADNHADSRRKRRHSHGRAHGMVRLTETEIIEIRQSELGARKLARQYGMHRTTMSKIRSKKLWAHI